jgi:hypothetical protein
VQQRHCRALQKAVFQARWPGATCNKTPLSPHHKYLHVMLNPTATSSKRLSTPRRLSVVRRATKALSSLLSPVRWHVMLNPRAQRGDAICNKNACSPFLPHTSHNQTHINLVIPLNPYHHSFFILSS